MAVWSVSLDSVRRPATPPILNETSVQPKSSGSEEIPSRWAGPNREDEGRAIAQVRRAARLALNAFLRAVRGDDGPAFVLSVRNTANMRFRSFDSLPNLAVSRFLGRSGRRSFEKTYFNHCIHSSLFVSVLETLRSNPCSQLPLLHGARPHEAAGSATP